MGRERRCVWRYLFCWACRARAEDRGSGGAAGARRGVEGAVAGEVRAVYEAGPTGFELARAVREAGVEVMVCAPGAIPRQPGDRIKTDTRDALKLARLHAAGQLRPLCCLLFLFWLC